MIMVYRTLGFFLNMMIELIFVFTEYSSCATYQAQVVLTLLYVIPSDIRCRVADVKVRRLVNVNQDHNI